VSGSSARGSCKPSSSAAQPSAAWTISRPASAKNIAHLQGRFDFVECDLRDADATARACEGIDFIFHQAARPSVPRSVKDPRTSHTANLDGTFNLLEGARAAGVKRIIYAASSSAYGNQPGFPRRETMVPMPIAPYPVQKLAGEFYMKSYWQVYGIETVCLRYFNIFGPRQVPDSPYSGRHGEVHAADDARRAAYHLRRRRAGTRLHLRRERGLREPAGPRSSRGKKSRGASSTSPAASATL